MVSRKKTKRRKKAKGKAAKAAAFKPFSLTQFKKSTCTHGWDNTEYSNNHECYKFIEAAIKAFRRTNCISYILKAANDATFEKYPEIWKDPTKLEWIASAFVSIGVEAIIREGDKFLCVSSVAYSEWIHQYVAFALHKSMPSVYSARLNELVNADERRIISYLKKRIPCSCLNSSYNAVKHLPKKGICCFPGCSCPERKVELSEMWSCEACRREHYCSEECQAANWSRHRKDCKVWSEWKANCGSSQSS
eukprot:scaffold1230_cov97-Skeletonema_dohrnii-CCMP3373.AAC.13